MNGAVLALDVCLLSLTFPSAFPPEEHQFLNEAPIAIRTWNGGIAPDNATMVPVRLAGYLDLVRLYVMSFYNYKVRSKSLPV